MSVMELRKNEELFFLVGQQGESACIKSFGVVDDCRNEDLTSVRHKSKIEQLKRAGIRNGAGGGGGASFVFLVSTIFGQYHSLSNFINFQVKCSQESRSYDSSGRRRRLGIRKISR